MPMGSRAIASAAVLAVIFMAVAGILPGYFGKTPVTEIPKGIVRIELTDVPPSFYDPQVVKVNVGDSVEFICADRTQTFHTVTAIAGPELFDSGPYCGTWKHQFTKPGEYTYICAIHPYMKGIVAVGVEPTARYAVTGEDGKWPPNISPKFGKPKVPGRGEVWVDIQWFDKGKGKERTPGAIAILDAKTWEVKETLPVGNNPHNLWDSLDGNIIYQTSWHSTYISVYDRAQKKWVVDRLEIGQSPAHVFVNPKSGKLYVSVNAENWVAVVDPKKLEITNRIVVSENGPHGLWTSPDGKLLVVPLTLSHHVAIIDAQTEKEIIVLPVGRLPLAAGVTPDGKKAYVSSALDGTVTVIDLHAMKVVRTIRDVGKLLIQTPVSPDGKYVVVASSGTGEVAIIDAVKDEVVKKLPAHLGAHGVVYGQKEGGGYYAYVSNKYADILTVIDMDTLSVAGEVKLPAAGGNGIHVLPNPYFGR